MSETEIALLLCGLLAGGDTEVSHDFDNLGGRRGIRVDCETETHVIEVGLDKTSSRDSLHQALFAAELTGKIPLVVLIDRDGEEGRTEYEMRRIAERAGVGYVRCAEHMVVRWRATQPWRSLDGGTHDLPQEGPARGLCNLARYMPPASG
ncbi:hypothetical protein LVO79_12185 [Roseivivax marinus]|uniref:hypothetical protein n=1 Tax=Roseivivax marinus TaxID=1379903 RepID=UPI001F044569|nr:hypothetical protein [Roseivivax marinus]UMA63788.1 hypothetical protein LVO79_12185 [Roseivivax marinus]